MPLLNANTFTLLTDPVTLTVRDPVGVETVVPFCMMTQTEVDAFEQHPAMQEATKRRRFHLWAANLQGVTPVGGGRVITPDGAVYRVENSHVQAHGARFMLEAVMEEEP